MRALTLNARERWSAIAGRSRAVHAWRWRGQSDVVYYMDRDERPAHTYCGMIELLRKVPHGEPGARCAEGQEDVVGRFYCGGFRYGPGLMELALNAWKAYGCVARQALKVSGAMPEDSHEGSVWTQEQAYVLGQIIALLDRYNRVRLRKDGDDDSQVCIRVILPDPMSRRYNGSALRDRYSNDVVHTTSRGDANEEEESTRDVNEARREYMHSNDAVAYFGWSGSDGRSVMPDAMREACLVYLEHLMSDGRFVMRWLHANGLLTEQVHAATMLARIPEWLAKPAL